MPICLQAPPRQHDPQATPARRPVRNPRLGQVLMLAGSPVAAQAAERIARQLELRGLQITLQALRSAAEAPPPGEWDLVLADPTAQEAARRLHAALPAEGSARDGWIARPLEADFAALAADASQAGWFDGIVERVQLNRSHRLQREALLAYERELRDREASLSLLTETGLMLSTQRDGEALLKSLLHETQKLLQCDAGTLYLVTDHGTLRFAQRTRQDALPALEIPLHDPQTGAPNEAYVCVHAALRRESVVIEDVYADDRFDFGGARAFDRATGYRTVSMLAIPIAPRGGAALGVLQFINAIDPATGRPKPFARRMVPLVEALAAQAAVALDNLRLVASQKQLMESLIKVLATAIDAKSPYTGKHCARVPELAEQLAAAACRVTSGPLAGFDFATEEQWQEFRIGAWLHDCGKVTTPEYVIDKATKLETIYNRIHEVRTRFEVLHRELDIEALTARLEGRWTAELEAGLERRRARLFDDFAFVAQCNLGSEEMADADVERLQRIAATPFTRHFDDRLGLSPGELERFPPGPAALPAQERLLDDRPWHAVPRTCADVPDPSWRFNLQVPRHLYHHGELYNLSIRRGTLTAEERYKVNEHMVHTVMMLEQMPFPPELQRVPEYAGTHHERMDGRGYPRGLSADELSVPARIMAIADVFEALTAADRPYKKAKTLSEALTVLRSMAGHHIDAELYNLFVSSGVFRDFAARHLRPEQIDVVDGTPYLVPHG